MDRRRIELSAFFDRLDRRGGLDAACKEALVAVAGAPRHLPKGECLQQGGDRVEALTILCSGATLSTRRLNTGAQHHLTLHTPGEMLDFEGYVLGRSTNAVCTVEQSHTIRLSRTALGGVLDHHPHLAQTLQREAALNVRIAQERMVSMGRRSAFGRLAHFVCEMSARVAGAGASPPDELPFALTQADLADLLGLSVVHMNRSLQRMQRERLL